MGYPHEVAAASLLGNVVTSLDNEDFPLPWPVTQETKMGVQGAQGSSRERSKQPDSSKRQRPPKERTRKPAGAQDRRDPVVAGEETSPSPRKKNKREESRTTAANRSVGKDDESKRTNTPDVPGTAVSDPDVVSRVSEREGVADLLDNERDQPTSPDLAVPSTNLHNNGAFREDQGAVEAGESIEVDKPLDKSEPKLLETQRSDVKGPAKVTAVPDNSPDHRSDKGPKKSRPKPKSQQK